MEQTERALPPLVLIVDDFEDAREMYSAYLIALGYRTALASNGFEALLEARRSSPDVIVMDLAMPTLDGWETMRRLKDTPKTSGIPVVVVSGFVQPEQEARARREGRCVDFLQKPVLPESLANTIDKLVHLRDPAPAPHAG